MARSRAHDDLLKRIDMLQVIRDFVDSDEWDGENIPCIFAEQNHDSSDDSNPSMSIDKALGQTICFACDYRASTIVGLAEDVWQIAYKTSVFRLWAKYIEPLVDEEELSEAHETLIDNKKAMKVLRNKRGILKSTIKKLKFGWVGNRLWIPVRNAHGFCVDVRRYDLLNMRAEGKAKIFSYAKGYGGARVYPHNFASKAGPYFLFEGEMDTALAIEKGLNGVTITGGALTIPRRIAKAFKDEEIIIVPDNDKAGLAGARKRFETLVSVGAAVAQVDPPWGKSKDFTDWIMEDGGNAADLINLTDEAVTTPVVVIEVDEEVDLSITEKEQESITRAELVLRRLMRKGAFFKNDGGQVFYSFNGRMIDITSRRLESHLHKLSPLINPASPIGRFIINHIRCAAIDRAELTEIGAWSLFKAPGSIYIHSSRNQILRVDSSTVELQPNASGEDNVLIEAMEKGSAVNWLPRTSTRSGIKKMFGLIANNIPCSDEDRYLIICWMMGVFYRELIGPKPLMRFVAKSGQGKSTASKLISQLVYGEELLSPPASTVASAYSLARSHPILLFDNFETRNMTPQFQDFLLTASTGGVKSKRAIDSDSGVVLERVSCLVSSNGIEPLSRSELINRTVEIEFSLANHGREGYHEFEILKAITVNRDEIFSALIKAGQQSILPRILDGEIGRIAREFPDHAMSRFDDYWALMAIFLDALWEHRPLEGYETPGKLMNKWLNTQSASAEDRQTDTDDVLAFLTSYVSRQELLQDTTLKVQEGRGKNGDMTVIKCTALELLNDFRVLGRSLNWKVPWENPKQLGSRLMDAEETLKLAGWSFRKYRSGGRSIIKFIWSKPE